MLDILAYYEIYPNKSLLYIDFYSSNEEFVLPHESFILTNVRRNPSSLSDIFIHMSYMNIICKLRTGKNNIDLNNSL